MSGRGRLVPVLLGLLLPLAAEAQAGAVDPRPRVREIELVLPPGEDPAAAAALLTVAEGDVLSSRALRATVQRLHQTGRYRNVVVRSEPSRPPPGERGDWVKLTVEAQAQRRIARVSVRSVGPAVLSDDELRAAARLVPGDPFEDGDLEGASARLRAALGRRGYRAPELSTNVQGDTALTIEIAVSRGQPLRVRAVRVEGDAAQAEPALAGLATRPGAILDEDRLAEDVRTLRAALHAAGWRRARVGAPIVDEEGEGQAAVSFPVKVGPIVRIVFRGNAVVAAEQLERQMGLERDQPLDVNALDTAVDRLRAFYRARGYAAAQVEYEEVPRSDHLAVVFRIQEGARYRIAAVRFEGVDAHPAPWLRARLLSHLQEDGPEPAGHEEVARLLAASLPGVRPPRRDPPELPQGDYHDETSWERAAQRIAEDLRGEGYLEAIALGASISLDGSRRTVEVTVRFREGPRTTVEAVRFEGNEALTMDDLGPLPRLAPGDSLAYARVEEIRSLVLRRYASRGRVFARVETRLELDPERHTAVVRFVIEEGPEVRVARILTSGNRRTRESVIRENLRLREGAVFDPEAAARSQSALLDTGVFRSVDVRMQDPDVPQASKDVVVEVVERPYATLTQGIGFSIANGPRATLEYARPNLFGRALELTLRGKVNYPTNSLGFRPDLEGREPADRVEGQFNAGLRTARLAVLPFPASGRVNLIGEVVHRPAYNLKRVSAVTGIDVGVTSRATFSLQYELEVDGIDRTGAVGPLTQVDLERLRFDEGTTTLHAVRPSFALDHRDNSTHPHSGWYMSGWFEYEHSLGKPGRNEVLWALPGSDIHTNLVKASGLLSGYVPLGGRAVLALSARAGQVFPLDPRSRTIVPRRFFLGGASTLRGFGEEQLIQEDVRPHLAAEARQCATSVTSAGCTERGRRAAGGSTPVSEGGEAFLLGKAELRLPLTAKLEIGLFVEAGNLWLDPKRVNPRVLRPSAGVGARFVTPIGPAALDFGFNLDRDDRINEEVFAPHFTIGLF